MTIDLREDAAAFYDFNPLAPDDLPFYRDRVPSPDARVLELGCGTGRVLVPLAACCGAIHGLDCSEAMLSICRDKLRAAGVPPERARVERADIADFDLGRRFDLVIAPYRVLQNLESDAEVEGLFRCVRRHLAPGGSCVLNVFRPALDPEGLRSAWRRDGETFAWEVAVEGGRITCHDRRRRVDPERMIIYPDLVYRRFEGETLVEEVALEIAMRCYYPQEFLDLIEGHGFRVLRSWGGYAGEEYGKGNELVVEFDCGEETAR